MGLGRVGLAAILVPRESKTLAGTAMATPVRVGKKSVLPQIVFHGPIREFVKKFTHMLGGCARGVKNGRGSVRGGIPRGPGCVGMRGLVWLGTGQVLRWRGRRGSRRVGLQRSLE